MSYSNVIDFMCTESFSDCIPSQEVHDYDSEFETIDLQKEEEVNDDSDHRIRDFVYEALSEFIERVRDTKEARESLSEPESFQIITGCVQNLLDLAYQVTRIVPWTNNAKKLEGQLRKEIDRLDNWGYNYDYLQLEFHTSFDSIELHIAMCTAQSNLPNRDCMFSFQMLSINTPDLYVDYLCKLNDLITYYSNYDKRSDFVIAKQAVKIGRSACSLANTLLEIMQQHDSARKAAIFTVHFSFRLLITPMLVQGFQVCHTCVKQEEREKVWDTLRVEAGYTEDDIKCLEYYTIVGLRHPLKTDDMVGFAVINHDVAYPFRPPRQELPVEFQYPYVDVRYVRIDPDYRRCGAGGYLLKHIKTSARENNYEAMVIFETENMLNTNGFWKAMGFKESKFLSGWYEIELNP
jgi:GNAT superfamily N-acetyltransferase